MSTATPKNQQAGEVNQGTCCLSGLECPANIPTLVILQDRGKEFLVSKHCLDKYSRQLYTFGIAAMARMMNSRVLVSGLSGLGVEVAKNVILAGVKSFVLHDTVRVTFSDLSAQFYCNETQVGTINRAEACVSQLRELNDLVPVEVITTELTCTAESLGSFTVVVLVDYHETQLREFGDYCHKNGICLIATGSYGLYGYSFSDFGSSHVVSDVDGEAPKAGLVVSFEEIGKKKDDDDEDDKDNDNEEGENGDDGDDNNNNEQDQKQQEQMKYVHQVVIRSDTEKTGLSDGDHVSLSVLGANVTFSVTCVYKKVERKNTKNNTVKVVKVRDFSLFAIQMDGSTLQQLSSSSSGPGYWTQIKIPTTIVHQPFSVALGHQSTESTESIESSVSSVILHILLHIHTYM